MRRIIPQHVDLPFGFRVYIRRISPAEMADRLDDEEGESIVAAGFWDYDEATIYLDKTLPIAKQRYILAHELLHAVNDWVHHLLNNGVAETL